MIKCQINHETTTFGKDTFCKTCGMDLDFENFIVRSKKGLSLYCCEVCAKAR